jgi:hypothetical protein
LLLTTKSLRAILQLCQKAAESSLRSLVIDDSVYLSLTETAVGTNEPSTGSRFPATPALAIEALSSFRTMDLRVLLLQPLHEGHLLVRQQKSLWRKTGLTLAVIARALFGWPLILLHHRGAYYWISLAKLHDRYMTEVIIPWVDEIGRAMELLREETVPRRIATAPAEDVSTESRHRQVGRSLALYCNTCAMLAVLF